MLPALNRDNWTLAEASNVYICEADIIAVHTKSEWTKPMLLLWLKKESNYDDSQNIRNRVSLFPGDAIYIADIYGVDICYEPRRYFIEIDTTACSLYSQLLSAVFSCSDMPTKDFDPKILEGKLIEITSNSGGTSILAIRPLKRND
jgi:hypothetical protein